MNCLLDVQTAKDAKKENRENGRMVVQQNYSSAVLPLSLLFLGDLGG
jgi:hypothetical protein